MCQTSLLISVSSFHRSNSKVLVYYFQKNLCAGVVRERLAISALVSQIYKLCVFSQEGSVIAI